MIYINLDEPFETAVARLKVYYGEKANQGMIEHLVRERAIKLGMWPGGDEFTQDDLRKPDHNAGGVWPWPPSVETRGVHTEGEA